MSWEEVSYKGMVAHAKTVQGPGKSLFIATVIPYQVRVGKTAYVKRCNNILEYRNPAGRRSVIFRGESLTITQGKKDLERQLNEVLS